MSASDRQTHNSAECLSAECLQRWHQSQSKQTLAAFPCSESRGYGSPPSKFISVGHQVLVAWFPIGPHCSGVDLSVRQVALTTDLSPAQEVIKQSTNSLFQTHRLSRSNMRIWSSRGVTTRNNSTFSAALFCALSTSHFITKNVFAI